MQPSSATSVQDRANSFKPLTAHYEKDIKPTHLRDLLKDEARNSALTIQLDNIFYDFSHERVTQATIEIFKKLIIDTKVAERVEAMFNGDKINVTEGRAVLHTALRAKENEVYNTDGKNVVPDVYKILNRISDFSDKVRSGKFVGFSNKELKNVVVIGIGGSYLGVEFVYEAIRMHPACSKAAAGRTLKFLANVDPNDFARATTGLDPEQTLVVVSSKTFTTAETMLNARTIKNWILEHYKKQGIPFKEESEVTSKHLCAASTNVKETHTFGISDENVFGFWDWVGGRLSVCSAIGVLPLSLHFGYDKIREFLDGANSIDHHFRETKDLTKNIPLMLGVMGFYNAVIIGNTSRAILPYSQAMRDLAPHIQQLVMESNGKRVSIHGEALPYNSTAVHFGEPGTNGQHSFYQLLHQGLVVPAEFIGFCKSQTPIHLPGEPVTNHDELMSNFFSQPDALACGKTIEELKAEKVPDNLLEHKYFSGNRPSSQILLDELNPFTTGQILAIYEHRTVVEGFILDVNSFDQWGVELGKALAKEVRNFMHTNKVNSNNPKFEEFNFNSSTKGLLKRYCAKKE